MTSSRVSWVPLVLGVVVLGCGPGQLPGIEGFSDGFGDEIGGSESETSDPTDPTVDPTVDPTETTDPTDPVEECPNLDFGSSPSLFVEDFIDTGVPSGVAPICWGFDTAERTITWTPTQTGDYQVVPFGFDAPVQVAVLEGSCGGVGLTCALNELGGTFFGFEGQTYTFVVESDVSTFYQLFVDPIPVSQSCPVGELGGIEGNVFGATSGASNYSPSCAENSGPEQGWLFVPPLSGTYRFDTAGSSYDTVIELVEGECGGASLGCVDDVADSLQAAVEAELQAGQVYTVFVDGWGGSAGDYQLSWSMVGEAPSLCDSAEVLPSQLPFGLTWEAGISSGNEFGGCGDFPNERRFRWTAPQDALINISQQTLGVPGALTVFEAGCADVGFECVSSIDTASLQLPVTAGQELLIVGEYSPGGAVELLIEEVVETGCGFPLPAGVPSSTMGTTNGSGDDFMGSCAFNPAPEREFWWTAPATGTYQIDTIGSNYDTLLHVRDGGCEGNELACDDDLGGNLASLVTVNLQAGQIISIFVDGFSGPGSFQLHITQI